MSSGRAAAHAAAVAESASRADVRYLSSADCDAIVSAAAVRFLTPDEVYRLLHAFRRHAAASLLGHASLQRWRLLVRSLASGLVEPQDLASSSILLAVHSSTRHFSLLTCYRSRSLA